MPDGVAKISPVPLPPRTPEQIALSRKIGRAFQKAEALLEQNQIGAADQAMQEAAQLRASLRGSQRQTIYSPGDTFTDLQARIYFRQNKYEQAAALYGFRADPYGNLNLNTALALVKTGRVAESKKAWKGVHLLAYHDYIKPYLPGERTARDWEATLFLARGMVDFDERRYGSTAWALEHAVQRLPHNPVALWYYGRALAMKERPAEARAWFQKAVRADKIGTIANQARQELRILDTRGVKGLPYPKEWPGRPERGKTVRFH